MMGKKKVKAIEGFVMFDVVYEDGTRSSRRKVAAAEVAERSARDHADDQHRKTRHRDQVHGHCAAHVHAGRLRGGREQPDAEAGIAEIQEPQQRLAAHCQRPPGEHLPERDRPLN